MIVNCPPNTTHSRLTSRFRVVPCNGFGAAFGLTAHALAYHVLMHVVYSPGKLKSRFLTLKKLALIIRIRVKHSGNSSMPPLYKPVLEIQQIVIFTS